MPIGIDKKIGVRKAIPNKPYLLAIFIITTCLILLFFFFAARFSTKNLKKFWLKKEKIKMPITPPVIEKIKVCKKLKSYLIIESGIANKNLTPLKEITANIFNKIDTVLKLVLKRSAIS